MTHQKITWKEKISYGLGDMASSFTFSAISLYLLYFYTDVAGILPAALTNFFLIMRIWDGINDPLMGLIVDRTKSKWGKSRPYFLWMAVPYGVIAVLIFVSPNFSMTGKIIWAYATYIVYDIIYTAINLPLSSILPSMTENRDERTNLNAVRMFLARMGSMIVTVSMLPLVALFGKGDEAVGFRTTMIAFGLVGIIMFLLTFANTRERVNVTHKKIIMKDEVKAIIKNKPWWILLFVNFILWIGVSIQQASILYYFKYVINNSDLSTPFTAVGFISTLIGISIAPHFTKKMGKRNVFLVGNAISIIGFLIMLFVGTKSIPLLFVGAVLSYSGTGFGTPLIYSMLADTVEYGEYLTGIRAQGLVFSASSFGIKCGMGIGTALLAYLLAVGNYVANVEQVASAISAIKASFLIIPLIAMIIITILLPFYKLDKEYPEIKAELEKRRGVIDEEPVSMSAT